MSEQPVAAGDGHITIEEPGEQRKSGGRGGDAPQVKFEVTDKSLDFLGFKTLKDLLGSLGKSSFGRHDTRDLATGVESVEATDEGLKVKFGEHTEVFDRILVAVGRKPNGQSIGAEAAGVNVTDRGFIESDDGPGPEA